MWWKEQWKMQKRGKLQENREELLEEFSSAWLKGRWQRSFEETEQWYCCGTSQTLRRRYGLCLCSIFTSNDLSLLLPKPLGSRWIGTLVVITEILPITILLGPAEPVRCIECGHQRLFTNKKLLWVASPGFQLLVAYIHGDAIAN